jgi:molecular chaperone DnaK (HSP70)
MARAPPREAAARVFPDADFAQAAPDAAAWGAALYAAQETSRLPRGARAAAAVPQSIGASLVGGTVRDLVHRGESLPAEAQSTYRMTPDGQETLRIKIYQGEHLLASRADRIGVIEFAGLPPLARSRFAVVFRVECDHDGAVNVSARTTGTKDEVSAALTVCPKYAPREQALPRAEERRRANVAWLREKIRLAIVRAERRPDPRGFMDFV